MKNAIAIGVGPTDGFGGWLCRRFADLGLHVFAVGRSAAKVEAVARWIVDAGAQATGVVADATSEKDITALYEQVVTSGDFGACDL